mmetsp:Transcript_6298/g.25300  ORF Transcript_6298/g.25300 Transcript_6298/m.25300 type:complete len:313 (-) Transcript_6298:2165-3103(-)
MRPPMLSAVTSAAAKPAKAPSVRWSAGASRSVPGASASASSRPFAPRRRAAFSPSGDSRQFSCPGSAIASGPSSSSSTCLDSPPMLSSTSTCAMNSAQPAAPYDATRSRSSGKRRSSSRASRSASDAAAAPARSAGVAPSSDANSSRVAATRSSWSATARASSALAPEVPAAPALSSSASPSSASATPSSAPAAVSVSFSHRQHGAPASAPSTGSHENESSPGQDARNKPARLKSPAASPTPTPSPLSSPGDSMPASATLEGLPGANCTNAVIRSAPTSYHAPSTPRHAARAPVAPLTPPLARASSAGNWST